MVQQGAKLRLRSGRLVLVDPEGEVLLSVPARKVRRVVVHGNVGLTTPAMTFLLKRGAEVVYLSTGGQIYGVASPSPLPSPARIEKQMAVARGERGLVIAKAIVNAKARSQIRYLQRQGLGTEAVEPLLELLGFLERAGDLDAVRGVEGGVSRLYFQLLGEVHPGLGFERRLRRPPRDPVNAALSYAYAILLAVCQSALVGAALHPEIGVLHATGRRRPSLALDLMEEFRVAVVDVPVVAAFLRGRLDRRAVELRDGGVFLDERGRRSVIELMEKRLASRASGAATTYLELIHRQAERLGSAIVHGKAYQPYVFGEGVKGG